MGEFGVPSGWYVGGGPVIGKDVGVLALPSLAAASALIAARRTNLRIDPHRPVDHALVGDLCRLATWAPNHHLTEPWRFAVLTGDARAELGRLTAEFVLAKGVADDDRLAKVRVKYMRAPLMLVVGCASSAGAHPDVVVEDRDAVAAGLQNILLGATAAGLCSFWGSGPVTEAPEVKTMCGFAAADQIVAVVYIGWPIGEVATPQRRDAVIHWLS